MRNADEKRTFVEVLKRVENKVRRTRRQSSARAPEFGLWSKSACGSARASSRSSEQFLVNIPDGRL